MSTTLYQLLMSCTQMKILLTTHVGSGSSTSPDLRLHHLKYIFNVSIEKYVDEKFCKLCFHEGEPVSVVHSHHNLDITCPSMTDMEKETMYGPNWIAKMYGYPD